MPSTSHSPRAIAAQVAAVLRSEGEAVVNLADDVVGQAKALAQVCQLILRRCSEAKRGRLVVTGVGKAGLIGRKLVATFASTGTPALFLHPAEARHGDLGMVQKHDVVLALSNSGSSEEVVALLPSLRHIGVPVVAIVGRVDSPLGAEADLVLSIGRVLEACPLGLAPSTSTTALLALGDAVALTIQGLRKFTPEQYARFHPGGALGRKLMTCAEAMRVGKRVATSSPETPVMDCLRTITAARAGSTLLVDAQQILIGIFTDGDLRRLLTKRGADTTKALRQEVRQHATCPCRSVRGDDLLQRALHLFAGKHIDELPVVDGEGRLLGLLDVQDLMDRGFEIGGERPETGRFPG